MNKLLTEAAPLDNRLLASDEEEYERIALHIVGLLEKSPDPSNTNLDNLDPATQTIPFLYVLNGQIDASINNGKTVGRLLPASVLPEGSLWPNIRSILMHFDPIQVRYVGRLLIRITEIVAKGAEQSQNAIPAIQLLYNTILRLDPTSSTLTTTHVLYVRLCLMAGAYADAINILNRPLSSIPSADATKQVGTRAYKFLCSVQDSSSVYVTPTTGLTQKITSRLYLEYFLMGGMCYMACGEFEKALVFYEIVLVTPTVGNVASAVMLEAYKKWVLVNLLVKGTDVPVPKAMSPAAIKIIRPLAKPYDCIVDAFKSNSIDRLQAEIQEGVEIWQADGNYGLVHEVMMSFRKFSIIKLGRVYAALTVEELAQRLSQTSADIANVLSYVQSLISSGQLQAELVPSTTGGAGTLRFGSGETVQLSETDVEAQLAERTRELQVLMKQVTEYDHQMTISKDYIDWLQKLKVTRDKEKKGAGAANRPIGIDMQDEDMMDDL